MDWKDYEKEILTYFQETYPETIISFDRKIQGKYSRTERQVDILIEGEVAGYKIKIVVDCKCFSKNIDIKQVESFCSMVEDLDAHQGVLITQKGYSKAAINRAYYGNHKLELDIINFDDLKEFQSFMALPYAGHFGVVLQAPFGWVLDLKEKINSFATLHQRGTTLREAQKKNEWMYMGLWKIDTPGFNIDTLIELQNKNIVKTDSDAKFIYNNLVKRTDGHKTKIRVAENKNYPSLEVTGYIQFEETIFFIVLFTQKELLSKNLRKLQYILKIASPAKLNFNNHTIIEQSFAEIGLTDNNEEKASHFYHIGIWYKEMDDLENTMVNLRTAVFYSPENYDYLKTIINESLSQELFEESKKFSNQLFKVQPKNPQLPQDLIDIYMLHEKPEILIEIFKEMIEINNDDEVLGNLSLHLSLLYLNKSDGLEVTKYMDKAKIHFKKVFSPNHYVFKAITDFEKEKNKI